MSLTYHRTRGFTLIEVLIALLILAIGLLGMVSLMMSSLQSNQSAYQRGQASMIAYDMADRLRLNSTLASSANDYVFRLNTAMPSDPNCRTTGCTSANIAALDTREWQENFRDVAGVGIDGNGYVVALPGAAGTVERAGRSYLITVSWTPVIKGNEDTSDVFACNGKVDTTTQTVVEKTDGSLTAGSDARCFFQLRVDL